MQLFVVDAFTSRAFAGNPAAVCLLDRPIEGQAGSEWMRGLAREMNLSETAFVAPIEGGYSLRWLTPATEVDLCGHATLACAWVLSEVHEIDARAPMRFRTRSGWLTCERQGDWIAMDFPATPAQACEVPRELIEGLPTEPLEILANERDYLVHVRDETTLRELQPDLERLARLHHRGVCVTARAEANHWNFVSRFFAPGLGVPEDPVTGSAHCMLGPFWAEKLGIDELVGYQASERGGVVHVRCAGDRVHLRGQAVTIARVLLREEAQPPKG